MTQHDTDFLGLLNQAPDTDFLKTIVSGTLQRLMEVDVSNQIQASAYGRREDRLTYRNGYRERPLKTCIGELKLQVPKLRQGTYFPPFLTHYQRADIALISVVQESYVGGISTRRMDRIIQKMGMQGVSKSQVSRLCAGLLKDVNEFLEAPIIGLWPYLYLDATYIKVRTGSRVVSKAAILAIGVNSEGVRRILGLTIQENESKEFWKEFLESLKTRGLTGVDLVISDAHKGLKEAISESFLNASWQRCWVHFLRNIAVKLPKTQQEEILGLVKSILAQDTLKGRQNRWKEVLMRLEKQHPKVAEIMETAMDDVLAHTPFPKEHHKKIYTNNPIERLNKEIKRRTKVVVIFPNDSAVIRLIGTILRQIDEDWSLGSKFLQIKPIKIGR